MTINKSEFFSIFISIFIGVIIYVNRIGYINFEKEITLTILLTLSIIFYSKYFSLFFVNKFNFNNSLKFPLKIINIFLILLLLYFISLISYQIIFLIFISLIPLFFFIKELIIYVKSSIIFIFISFIFSFWIVCAFYYSQYAHPLSYEQLAVGANFHRDTIWHASIAGMIKTYNLPSIGIDGLLTYHYHILSHFFSAKLSQILNVSTFKFYTLLFPIIFIPLFFLFFIESVVKLNQFVFSSDNNRLSLSNFFFISLLILFSIIFPYQYLNETYSFFYSYSYLLALLLLFTLIKLSLISFELQFKKKIKLIELSIIFLLLLIIYFFLIISKFSFLYFFSVTFIFFYFRIKLYKKKFFNLFFFCLAFINILTFYYVISPFMSYASEFGYDNKINSTFQNFYLNFKSTSSSYYTYLYYSIVFIFFRIISSKLEIRELLNKIIWLDLIKNKKIVDIEYLLFLSIVLFIFPWQYTNGIQIYIAYFFILSFLYFFLNSYYLLSNYKKIIISLAVSFFVLFSSLNFLKISLSFFAHNITIRDSFSNENNYNEKIDVNNDGVVDFVNKGIHEGANQFYENYYEFRRDLIFLRFNKIVSREYINPYDSKFSKEYKFLFFLEGLIDNLKSDPFKTAVFIPTKQRFNFFWRISCDSIVAPLIVPGIANLSIIDGLTDAINEQSCYGHKKAYGLNKYRIFNKKNNSDRLYDSNSKYKICEYVIKKNFTNVLLVDFNNEEFIFENLKCSKFN